MRNVLFFFVFICFGLMGQSPNPIPHWLWSKNYGGSGNETSVGVAINNNGDVYCTGVFSGSVMVVGTNTLVNTGAINTADGFVLKTDSIGNVIWVKTFQGSGNQVPQDIAIDTSGNVCIVGYFDSFYLVYGTDTLRNNNSNDELFVIKLDTNGNKLWFDCPISTSFSDGYGIATDKSNNIYVTGDFGWALTLQTYTVNSLGSKDVFIAKYNPNGGLVWLNSFGGNSIEHVNDIYTESDGDSYVTGYFYGSTLTASSVTLTNSGSLTTDIFTIKYDSSGNVIWGNSEGGSEDDIAYGVTVGKSGAVYSTGYFRSPLMTSGSLTVSNTAPFPHLNLYVVKKGPAGNTVWIRRIGDTINSGIIGYDISCDSLENIYVLGNFDTPNFKMDSCKMVNQGYLYEVFILKMDSTNRAIWAENSKCFRSNSYPTKVIVDEKQNIWFTGSFGMDSLFLGPNLMFNNGAVNSSDFFISKISNSDWFLSVKQTILNEKGITIYPNPSNGQFYILASEENKNSIFEIYNSLGQKIISKSLTSGVNEVDLTYFNSGIYYLKINGTKGPVYYQKFIKE